MSGQSNNHFSSYSQPSSLRSSDSTNATTSSTLFNPPPPLPTSTPNPLAQNDSVLNKRGDKEASLFQICLNLQQRLRGLPGPVAEALFEEEERANVDIDPVSIIWRLFRRGYPLMDLYNTLGIGTPLEVDPAKVAERKRPQAATFKFIFACMKELQIKDSFVIIDLHGDDTAGLVKVPCFRPHISHISHPLT
jgi:cell division control protein 24